MGRINGDGQELGRGKVARPVRIRGGLPESPTDVPMDQPVRDGRRCADSVAATEAPVELLDRWSSGGKPDHALVILRDQRNRGWILDHGSVHQPEEPATEEREEGVWESFPMESGHDRCVPPGRLANPYPLRRATWGRRSQALASKKATIRLHDRVLHSTLVEPLHGPPPRRPPHAGPEGGISHQAEDGRGKGMGSTDRDQESLHAVPSDLPTPPDVGE